MPKEEEGICKLAAARRGIMIRAVSSEKDGRKDGNGQRRRETHTIKNSGRMERPRRWICAPARLAAAGKMRMPLMRRACVQKRTAGHSAYAMQSLWPQLWEYSQAAIAGDMAPNDASHGKRPISQETEDLSSGGAS